MRLQFEPRSHGDNWDEAIKVFCKLHSCSSVYARAVLPVVVRLLGICISRGNSIVMPHLGAIEAYLDYDIRGDYITQQASWEWIPEKNYVSPEDENPTVKEAMRLESVKTMHRRRVTDTEYKRSKFNFKTHVRSHKGRNVRTWEM